MPDTESLLRLLSLKAVPRKGWTRHPLPPEAVESVADHSYGVALLAWLLCPAQLDREKVLEIALLHDLAEVVTGDLTPQDQVEPERKRRDEASALRELLKGFAGMESALQRLQEYNSQECPEGRFVKAVDKLDMALQSLAYERAHGGDFGEFRDSARATLVQAGLLHWVEGAQTV